MFFFAPQPFGGILNRDNNKPLYVRHNIDLAPPNIYKYYICSKVNTNNKSE